MSKATFQVWLADSPHTSEDGGFIHVDNIPQALSVNGDYYRFKTYMPPNDDGYHRLMYLFEPPAQDIESLRDDN